MKESVQQIKQTAEETTEQVKHEVQERSRSLFASQTDRIAERLEGMAQAVMEMSPKLREKQQDTTADYADAAAEKLDRLSRYVRDKNLDDFMEDTRHLIQRQPGYVMAGAFALGFMISRFIKSSGGPSEMSRHYTHSPQERYYGYGYEREIGTGGIPGAYMGGERYQSSVEKRPEKAMETTTP
jgi:hypothetical protein